MSTLPPSAWGSPRLSRALTLVLLAAGSTSACEAGVFAIGDNGTVAPVSAFGAPPPDRLAVDSSPSPFAPSVDLTSVVPLSAARVPARFAVATSKAAAANGLAPDLLAAVVWQESRWRPNAVSSAGAVGLAQLMPATAGGMRIDPRDPVASLYGAAHYLRVQLDQFGGNVELALAAYNAGPTRVIKSGGVPRIAETRNYVTAIMDRLSAMPSKDN